ncbi:MAG TPA: ricin-type beta-trefoil lectin domain protein [Streptosporangiaceae bacterium]|nr:ricin-type beta-trefoil lectin domain protein [Streptosporangiaceae bacterium]
MIAGLTGLAFSAALCVTAVGASPVLAASTPPAPPGAVSMSVLQSPAASVPGFSPASLRGAYGLAAASARAGQGHTVAIVTPYSDPDAAADLAVYRRHFGLPACGAAGACLRIVNQNGSTSGLPAPSSSWAPAVATGLDVVSALCPKCRLLLVEARSDSLASLGPAENTAVLAGARFVLNAWAVPEAAGQDVYDHYFDHPGVAIVAAAGDSGYGSSFPGDLAYVTSVGGTSLVRSSFNARHWAETAWADTGSGCSALEAKPSWQRADASASTGCLNRTQDDVAADADPGTGAAVYDSYHSSAAWARAGGTALAAAIVASAYALAGTPAPRSYPASYPYQHPGRLNDVVFGSNGPCRLSPSYLCNAQTGFDGPTGLGTPEGTTAFSAPGTDPVTVMDPGTQDAEHGAEVSFTITGLDSRAGATLNWSASGLPAGLSISPVAHSTSARVGGVLPAAIHSYAVAVTATDPSTKKAATTHFSIVAAGSLIPAAPVTTNIVTDFSPPDGAGTECLDGGAETAGTAVTIQLCEESAQENWAYLPSGPPGGPAEITIGGLCLGLTAGAPTLATCDQSVATQGWRLLGGGGLQDAGSGTCLDAGAKQTGPLTLSACRTALPQQQWQLTAGTLQSAVPGICVAGDFYAPQPPQPPSPIQVEPCGQAGQDYDFTLSPNGQIVSGLTCAAPSYGYLVAQTCGGTDQDWQVLPGGQVLNQGTGLCLSDPAAARYAGTQLELQPCYGTLGEIWSLG